MPIPAAKFRLTVTDKPDVRAATSAISKQIEKLSEPHDDLQPAMDAARQISMFEHVESVKITRISEIEFGVMTGGRWSAAS